MQLNVYLFEPQVTELEDAFRPGQLPPDGPYEEVPLVSPSPFTGPARVFHLRNKESSPGWLDFFRGHCEFEDPETIRNRSNSLVLVLKTADRVFAMTHGQGYLALERGLQTPGFGLRVAINAVDPKRIRSTESRSLLESSALKQLVLGSPDTLDRFEVNFNRELLHRLEGALGNAQLGSRIRGASSCAISSGIEFAELEGWCQTLLEVFHWKTPQEMEKTSWLSPVLLPSLITMLERKLDEALAGGETEALHLSPANVREYNLVESYELRIADRAPVGLPELDFDLLRPLLAGLSADEVASLDIRLVGLNVDDETITDRPLRDTVVFETVHEENRYIHTPDGWVCIGSGLVEWVNRRMDVLGPPAGFQLPDWTKAYATEGDYNLGVATANSNTYYCLDKKLVTVETRGRIEVCDLLADNGDLIHVKEYKGSSQAISHLVAQAQGSSELMLDDQLYRKSVRDQLPKKWKKRVSLTPFTPSAHRVVLAIGAPPGRDLPGSLPFLSKQSILRAAESLTLMGFRAFVSPIAKS